MATERLLRLRLPRIVVGTVGRSARPERVAVWDEVPVRVPEYSYKETPVVLDHLGRSVHAIGGRAFVTLRESPAGPEAAWAGMAQSSFDESLKLLRAPGRRLVPAREGFYPWRDGLAGVSARRGFGPAAEVAFRSVEDDGLADQARKAQRLAGRIAVVGKSILGLASTPRYRVGLGNRNPTLSLHAAYLPWRHETPEAEPWGAFDFSIDRRPAAVAFMDKLGDRDYGYQEWGYRPTFKIRRPEEAAHWAAGGADPDLVALSAVAGGVIEAARPFLGSLPLGEVERWAALGRLRERGDLDGMRDWLEGAGKLEESLAASGAVPKPEHGDPDNALTQLRACLVRYREIERPRLHLDRDGDAAALMAL